jgi:hypothetical protein
MLLMKLRIVSTGFLLTIVLGVATACTKETPQEDLVYCQEWKTWNTVASSAEKCPSGAAGAAAPATAPAH